MEGNGCRLSATRAAAVRVSGETVRGARWALLTLSRALIEDVESGDDLCRCVDEVARIIAKTSPTMAPPHWIPRVIREACSLGRDPEGAVRGLLDYQSRSGDLLVHHGVNIARTSRFVITLSYSSTVEQLIRAVGRRIQIIVAESRPGSEGAVLAERLRSTGYDVRLVPDMALGLYLVEGAIVLFGADAVGRDGCVVNKVGSRLLALAARYAGVDVYSAFDATKLVIDRECKDIEIMSRQVNIEGFGWVEVPVFDRVEPHLLTGYITEAGILEPGWDSVRALAERLLELTV